MNVRQSYDQWAATYDSDRNLTRDLDETVTRRVLGGVTAGTVLELGCGTGKNTGFLAQIGRKVQALDFSPAMIARAREKLRLDHVTFAVTDLSHRWPVETRSVDLIAGNLVLEHLRDLGFIFAEAARVLVPGGRLFLCELHPFRQYEGAVARFGHGAENLTIAAHVHHVSDFVTAAADQGLVLSGLREWWHDTDADRPPRLLSLFWQKPAG